MTRNKRSLLKYLKYFGPGAVIAIFTMGAGDIVLAPRIGAWALPVYSALWIITFALITKGLTAYLATRYSLLSGEHIMTLFSRIKPRGWINIVSIIINLALLPFMVAAFLTVLGNSIALFTNVGNFVIWGISIGVIIAISGLISSYKVIEKIQLVSALFLSIGALIAVVVVHPDWFAMFKGFIIIQTPEIAPWVTAQDIITVPVMLQLAAIYGTMHGSYADFTAYISWWLEKVKEKKVALKSEIMTGMKLDLITSFVIVTIFMAAFLAAGVVILGERQLVPNGIDLISAQKSIYSVINPFVGNYLYPVAMLIVIGGAIYVGMDATPRMLKAWLDPISKRTHKLSFKRFQCYLILYYYIVGIPLMFIGQPIILMTVYLLFTGVFGMWLLGWGALWANQKHLPKEKRLSRWKVALFFINNIVVTVFIVSIILIR